MLSDHSGQVPIEWDELERHAEDAHRLLLEVRYSPTLAAARRESGGNAEETIRLVDIAKRISRDPLLFSEGTSQVLQAIRDGVRLGYRVAALYETASNLVGLKEVNEQGRLSREQEAEFRGKVQAASAIAAFSAAYYVAWKLARYRPDEVGNVEIAYEGLPEQSLRSTHSALRSMLFYLGRHLETDVVQTDLDFVKMTMLHCQAVIQNIQVRSDELARWAEAFTSRSYRLVGTDFSISGFEAELSGIETSVEFRRVSFEEIVGNREGKHNGRRIVQRLLCYDPEEKRNPMAELGGLPTPRLMVGIPGTGKSLLLAAIATELSDRCADLGLPFLFLPMPETVVSTFQGGSAERMDGWMRVLRDPSKIIYAPIDDAENTLEDRTRQGVSSGVREVIGTFLRGTEGATAVNHGNFVIDICTNLPDQLDKAVLSRMVDRFSVVGAQELEDFLDQDRLWWQRYADIDPDFVDMIWPDDYPFLSAQRQLASLSEESEATVQNPQEEKIQHVFERVKREYNVEDHRFFAWFYAKMQEAVPLFSSRDVRNIQRAVDNRILDFDIPVEWFDSPDVFLTHSCDRKKEMLVELMKANMGGLSFAEVRLQETLRYCNTLVEMSDQGFRRQVERYIEQIHVREAAERELQGRQS